ncbi:MAG TPA: sugar phosphate isomerase/epimerase family protein [Verrucomicrobiae bacterium]
MNHPLHRRSFLKQSSLALAGLSLGLAGCKSGSASAKKPWFEISLAEWSLHKAILTKRELTNLDFPKVTRREFKLGAVEYVNQMFMDKAKDTAYLTELKNICNGEGVRSVLIMCDREGNLGDPDAKKRQTAVENHYKWADAAKFLGCHSIRVNAATGNIGSFEEQQKRAADGLRKLTEFTSKIGINTIVENHGGLSSNGAWLSGVMKLVAHPNCGTLPDFGNFYIDRIKNEQYDRYQGVTELMPFAKGASAKTNNFDAQGNERHTDYRRMLKIVKDAGYRGYVGVEYEGVEISEFEGIRKTIALLETVRAELA